MNQASRIPASEKKPEDFLPPELPPVVKKVLTLTIKRADGSEESRPLILRPGDVAYLDGSVFAEG